jgi:hypothetical protein
MLQLPISVYQYDARCKKYVFQSCLQCVVEGGSMPRVLTSSAGQSMLRENLDLLKAAMRAPAVVLRKGTREQIFSAACEEVKILPPAEPVRVIRSYELPYVNLSTQIGHYRLRSDGALALVDTGRLHCAMCHVPEQMELDYVKPHLRSRALSIRKLIRDRRIVVEIGEKACVFSCETLKCKGGCQDPRI